MNPLLTDLTYLYDALYLQILPVLPLFPLQRLLVVGVIRLAALAAAAAAGAPAVFTLPSAFQFELVVKRGLTFALQTEGCLNG